MIKVIKKRTSFLLSILVTGILGTIGGYVSSNYSKDGSFLVPIAKADIPAPAGTVGTVGDSGGEAGDAAGGDCSSSSCY